MPLSPLMSSSVHLDNLKTTVLEFIADLKDNVLTTADDQGDLLLVQFFFSRLHPLMLMEHINKHVAPHHHKIKKRDVQFFIEQKDKIFAGLDASKVDHFANLCSCESSDGIGEENRNVIWSYFDTMLCIVEEYKKGLKRD